MDLDALSIAVLGASESLGAGAHPDLRFDPDFIWDVMRGEHVLKLEGTPELDEFIGKDREAPHVLWQGKRDFRGALDWVVTNLIHAFSQIFLDTEEYSFGYILARKLGAKGKDIYLAAELGAKMSALRSQAERLLNYSGGQLPEKMFIFFTGNDLCAHSFDQITTSEDFGQSLRRGLEFLIRNGKPHPRGTSVYVVGFLSATQVLLEQSIKDKQVWAFGQQVSCQALKERGFSAQMPMLARKHPESIYFAHYLPPNPVQLCPTFFALPQLARNEMGFFAMMDEKEAKKQLLQKEEEMISTLSGRIRNYRMQTEKVVGEIEHLMQKVVSEKKMSFYHLKSTQSLDITGDDMATDCFHLSVNGQLKVAKALYAELMAQKL